MRRNVENEFLGAFFYNADASCKFQKVASSVKTVVLKEFSVVVFFVLEKIKRGSKVIGVQRSVYQVVGGREFVNAVLMRAVYRKILDVRVAVAYKIIEQQDLEKLLNRNGTSAYMLLQDVSDFFVT